MVLSGRVGPERNSLQILILQVRQYLSMPKQKSTAPAASSVGKPKQNLLKPKQKKRKSKPLAFPPNLALNVNPWEAPSAGAGLPDHNVDPTIAWTEPYVFSATPDAQGNLMYMIRGSLVNGIYKYTLTAVADPVTSAVTNSDPPNFATLASTFTHYRPLAACVEMEYIGESQLCKGVFGIARAPTLPSGTGAIFSSYFDETIYRETTAEEKVAGKVSFTDGDFTSTSVALDTPAIVLFGSGLPVATNSVRIRVKFHFEFKVAPTSLYSRDAEHTISHPGTLATIASLLGPRATVAAGKDPVGDIVKHGEKLAMVAGAANGLWQAAKPVASLMAEFVSLL